MMTKDQIRSHACWASLGDPHARVPLTMEESVARVEQAIRAAISEATAALTAEVRQYESLITRMGAETAAEREAWGEVHAALGFGYPASDSSHADWLSNAAECLVAAAALREENETLKGEVNQAEGRLADAATAYTALREQVDRLTRERDTARKALKAYGDHPPGFDRIIATAVTRAESAEDALRSLASYLSVGGYNAAAVDPKEFEAKIRDGIDALTRPLQAHVEKAEGQVAWLKGELDGLRKGVPPVDAQLLAATTARAEQAETTLRRLAVYLGTGESEDHVRAALDALTVPLIRRAEKAEQERDAARAVAESSVLAATSEVREMVAAELVLVRGRLEAALTLLRDTMVALERVEMDDPSSDFSVFCRGLLARIAAALRDTPAAEADAALTAQAKAFPLPAERLRELAKTRKPPIEYYEGDDTTKEAIKATQAPLLVCSRSACNEALDGQHCAIWNDASTGTPRLYCVPCARKILDANQFDIMKLQHEWRVASPPPVSPDPNRGRAIADILLDHPLPETTSTGPQPPPT